MLQRVPRREKESGDKDRKRRLKTLRGRKAEEVGRKRRWLNKRKKKET